MHTTILVDGSNLWYRSYVATMLDPPGGPVLIATNALKKLAHHYGRDNVIVCWDAGRSGRKELDPDYKAKRSAAEGVWQDLPYMQRMVECVGLRVGRKEGFEADDVIGSLAHSLDGPVLIHSYDKDFYQLVTDRIQVFRPRRKVHGREIPDKIVGVAEAIEEFGCHPSKIVIFKAFKGDSSDNIPKIDQRFTQKFKDQLFKAIDASSCVEEVYKHLDLFDSAYQNPLIEFKERALLNEKLVSIYINLDVSAKTGTLDGDAFQKLCEECDINRLKFDDWVHLPKEPAPPPSIQRGLF